MFRCSLWMEVLCSGWKSVWRVHLGVDRIGFSLCVLSRLTLPTYLPTQVATSGGWLHVDASVITDRTTYMCLRAVSAACLPLDAGHPKCGNRCGIEEQ